MPKNQNSKKKKKKLKSTHHRIKWAVFNFKILQSTGRSFIPVLYRFPDYTPILKSCFLRFSHLTFLIAKKNLADKSGCTFFW